MKYLLLLLFFTCSVSANIPAGDTKGIVAAVTVDHSYNRAYDSFHVYFENAENDRWGCIAEQGRVTFRSSGVGVNTENFKMMYGMALAALTSGKKLAISHSGTTPCINANGTMLLN